MEAPGCYCSDLLNDPGRDQGRGYDPDKKPSTQLGRVPLAYWLLRLSRPQFPLMVSGGHPGACLSLYYCENENSTINSEIKVRDLARMKHSVNISQL